MDEFTSSKVQKIFIMSLIHICAFNRLILITEETKSRNNIRFMNKAKLF